MSILDAKIGGVPTVAIGGVVGVVVVGALYLQSRNGASAATAAANPYAYPEIGEGGLSSSASDGSSLTDTESVFTSNATWTAQAVAFLIKSGASPFAVSAALTKYLSGADLTEEELGWVNSAITKFGLPPQGTSGLSGLVGKVTKPVSDFVSKPLTIDEAASFASTVSFIDQPDTKFVTASASTPTPQSGTVNVISNGVSQNWAGQYMVAGRAVSPSEVAAIRSGATTLGGYGAESTAEIKRALQAAGLV